MGNAASSNAPSSFCKFNFLPAKVLTQTKLHPASAKKSTTRASTISDLGNKSPSAETNHEKKDDPDSPDSRDSPRAIKPNHAVTENDFHIIKVLGIESCGRAYLVRKDDDQQIYTMRAVSKLKAYSLGCIDSLYFEREVLKRANHPFLPKLKYSFENDKKIFFVFDYVKSEDLETVLHHLTRFSEEITKFYSAEILLALEYLHKEMKTSYDLTIRNVLLDSEGHIKLTNFSQSHRLDLELEFETETSKREMIDFKDFGRLIYELLTGQELQETEQAGIETQSPCDNKNKAVWPQYVSKEARDLITRLVAPQIEERLGNSDFVEIKHHPFFEGIQWKKMQKKLVYPPIDLACQNFKAPPSGESLNLSQSSHESCELDKILLKRPRDIIPDTARAESFEHCHPTFNRLEEI